jgi:hypothetical protein
MRSINTETQSSGESLIVGRVASMSKPLSSVLGSIAVSFQASIRPRRIVTRQATFSSRRPSPTPTSSPAAATIPKPPGTTTAPATSTPPPAASPPATPSASGATRGNSGMVILMLATAHCHGLIRLVGRKPTLRRQILLRPRKACGRNSVTGNSWEYTIRTR